jgi:hypothetical protein
MSRESCSSKFWTCICIISSCIIIASIIVGSIGAASYVKEKHDESIYKPTMCFVENYTITDSTCSKQQCNSNGFGQTCTNVYYTCPIELYIVMYNVSDGRQIQSDIKTKDGPGPNSVRIIN